MGYEVTSRIRQLLEEFRSLSDELRRLWLGTASEEARSEWESFCSEWPTDSEIERGLIDRSESELGWMLAKALRFRAVLAGASRQAAGAGSPDDDVASAEARAATSRRVSRAIR